MTTARTDRTVAADGTGDGTDARDRLRRELERRRARRAHPERDGRAGFAEHLNPELARLLEGFGLDRRYVRGDGMTLEDDRGRRCLDFAGAYGALPLGHHPAAVRRAITDVARDQEPVFVQPSILGAAGELAARLAALAPEGLDRVTFVNSGAEAVEVALKLARSATGRHGVISTDGGFHGKTLGALSVTGRDSYQIDFGAPVPGFRRVPFGDADALARALDAAPGGVAAVVLEPIQGEGGVHPAPPGYLAAVRRLCSAHGAMMVLDEVQTGLGRTGRMFACQHDGVTPDVITLAKALGGGMVPTGAVLSGPGVATESFALRHTSTFAGNALVARVGLAVLDELTADDESLVRRAHDLGEHLLGGLRRIAENHPSIVTDVRGRGLLLGVELSDDLNVVGDQGLVGSLADQENLALAVCTHLLEVEGIRLAPTLFGARVLRVEPALTVTVEECDRFLAALDRALAHVAAGDAAALLGHLVGQAPPAAPRPRRVGHRSPELPPAPGDSRFGFVVHPLDEESLVDFDPSLASLDPALLTPLLDRCAQGASVLSPAAFRIGSGRVGPASGRFAHGEIVGLPFTTRRLLGLSRREAVTAVQSAVDLAVELGAEVVGLGAYSSVVTDNGRDLSAPVPLTTGNSFTVAATLRAVTDVAVAQGTDVAELHACVIGAAGAIGRTFARLFAGRVGRLTMVGSGRSGAAERMRSTADAVVAAAADGEGGFADAARRALTGPDPRAAMERAGVLVLSDDPGAAVAEADVVVTATSAPRLLVDPARLRTGAVVCDVAQPANVPTDLPELRPDVTLFDGGIVELPAGSDLRVRYGLPPELTFACMAETMLISLSGETDLVSMGTELSAAAVNRLDALADDLGFRLARHGSFRAPAPLVGVHAGGGAS